VQEYEFKDGIMSYLATRRGPGPKDLQGLIDFNNEHAAEEMPYFGQDVFIAAEERGPLSDQTYREAYERVRRLAGPEGIDAALSRDHLDALISPTTGPAEMIDFIAGPREPYGAGDSAFSMPPAAAGYPVIVVPMGMVHGL